MSLDGEPMERAIPADKVASAPESPFFTSFLEVGAGISAGALDLRKGRITEVDDQVDLNRVESV